MSHSPRLIILGIILMLTLGMQFLFEKNIAYFSFNTEKQEASIANASASSPIFPQVTLEARAAVVYDITAKKIIFEKNAKQVLPLASLTKIATVLGLYQNFSTQSTTRITEKNINEEGDSGLQLGELWDTKDLARFSLLVSSNDGASALAASMGDNHSFLSFINNLFEPIGNRTLSFSNESGLDNRAESRTGGVGSAYDMTLLFEQALAKVPEVLESTAYNSWTFTTESGTHEAKNTNELVPHIPGLIAGKTGYTDLAGGNLIVAFDTSLGRPVIVCVLGSSREGRFTDVQKLTDATLAYMSQ